MLEASSYTEAIYKKIDNILCRYQPTKSGVKFCLSGRTVFLLPPMQPVVMSDEEHLEWFRATHNINQERWALLLAEPGKRSSYLREAKVLRATEHIGGVGISSRTIDDTETELPTITERMLAEKGKIVFLGNGLSSIPIVVAERFAHGQVEKIPTIVDIFDYQLLLEDFKTLLEVFAQNNIPFPLRKQFSYLIELNNAIEVGCLDAVVYYFGSGNPPSALKDTMLAVNCSGPPESTLDEQLSTLAPEGELYTTYPVLDLPLGFQSRVLREQGIRPASVVKRLF